MKRLLLALLAFSTVHAADVSISGLPAITTVQAGTLVPVVDVAGTPTTKKATVSQLLAGLPNATTTTDGTMAAADKLTLTNATPAASASTVMTRDGSGASAVTQLTAATVTGLGLPVNASDAANKQYVDTAAEGLNIKTPAAAATTGDVTLSGGAPTVVDGVTLALNTRVLVKAQADDTQNGIYYVTTLGTGGNGTWARTSDADTGDKLTTGSYVYVTGGTAGINSAWVMSTPGTITIGSSHITWALFSQFNQILAANILGQIISDQIKDAAINTAKFASGLEPVVLVATLPSPTGYTGPKTLFNTSDGKLYRYIGTSFTAQTPTSDLSGSIEYGQIAANAVHSNEIYADSVIAGKISAGAVNTRELYADAVKTEKIYAGAITGEKITVDSIMAHKILAGIITADQIVANGLSAISANIGTITAGSISASASISLATSNNAVTIDSTGMTVAGGRISLKSVSGNPAVTIIGSGSFAGDTIQINGYNGSVGPFLTATYHGGTAVTMLNGLGVNVSGTGASITVNSGNIIRGSGSIKIVQGSGDGLNVVAGEVGSASSLSGYMTFNLNGRLVAVPFYTP